jgi:hypothetical protein
MRFSIDVGSELELKLYQAVLLYRNDHGNRFMATVHGVVQKETDGTPLLGSGQLLSTAALRELTKQLGTSCPAEFLPESVVARTPELIAWWMPAAVRPMFFRDVYRTVQKDLDIREYTDPEHNPMIPHTLVLKPGLVIHRIYNGYWFWGRPSVVDLWHDLRAVTSEIRPDWDLSTPGLREAWTAGDYSPFHGWNNRTDATQSRVGREQSGDGQ